MDLVYQPKLIYYRILLRGFWNMSDVHLLHIAVCTDSCILWDCVNIWYLHIPLTAEQREFLFGLHCHFLKGSVPRKSMWALSVPFSKKTTMVPFIRVSKHANRSITTQSWDYLVYLHDLAVHKDHLPHRRMISFYYDITW